MCMRRQCLRAQMKRSSCKPGNTPSTQSAGQLSQVDTSTTLIRQLRNAERPYVQLKCAKVQLLCCMPSQTRCRALSWICVAAQNIAVGVDDVQWLLHMPVDIASRLSHSADPDCYACQQCMCLACQAEKLCTMCHSMLTQSKAFRLKSKEPKLKGTVCGPEQHLKPRKSLMCCIVLSMFADHLLSGQWSRLGRRP